MDQPYKITHVNSYADLMTMENLDEGTLYFCKEPHPSKLYTVTDGKLTPIEASSDSGLQLNLYDLNKNIINQLDPMTEEEIKSYSALIDEYKNNSNNTHHMLLCRDYNYYTIFEWSEFSPLDKFSNTVIEIISELGTVYSIERLEDGAIEIWIKPTEEESVMAFYLFPYDAGVVYYG